MTAKQAAARAAVSLSLIYAWCRTGMLKHSRFGIRRGCIRIAESDLLAFLAECERRGQPSLAGSPPLKHIS